MKNREFNFGPLKRGVLVPYGKHSFFISLESPIGYFEIYKVDKTYSNKGSNCNRNVTYSLIFQSCPNEREKKQKKKKGRELENDIKQTKEKKIVIVIIIW